MELHQHTFLNIFSSEKPVFESIGKRLAPIFGWLAMAFLPAFLMAAPPAHGPEKGKAEPPVAAPAISISQMVTACDPVGGGNLKVTFQATIQNTGNSNLTNMSVFAPAASQFGGFFVSATPAVTVLNTFTTAPTINPAYNGNGANELFATSGSAAPGQRYTFTYMVIVDPNAAANTPDCQLLVRANGGVLRDESDAGDDPTSSNPTFFGDLVNDAVDLDGNGNPNDDGDASPAGGDEFDNPTPVPMSRVSLTKQQTSFQPSADCEPGNYDVTFRLIFENTGNVPVDQVQITDDFVAQIGGNFVQVVDCDVLEPASTAFINPVVNAGYDGGLTGQSNIFVGLGGYVRPGERIELDLVVKINLENGGLCATSNQATMVARPGFENFPGDLVPIIMPDGSEKMIVDASDDGDTPDGTNPGFFGDTGGEDDPTAIQVPDVRVTKKVIAIAPVCTVDPCAAGDAPTGNTGNYAVTIEYHVKNTGNVSISDLQLNDGIDPENWRGLLCPPTITLQSGTVPAVIDGAYNGNNLGAQTDMFVAGNQFDCGQEVILEATFEIDPNGSAGNLPYLNTAFATGFAPDIVFDVFDASDSGADPDSNNPGEQNASATTVQPNCGNDDPTPLSIPAVAVTKEVTNIVDAASEKIGNFDVTFHFVFQNIGNVPLDNLQLTDILTALAPVSMPVPPFQTGASTATVLPVFDPGFSSFSTNTIFDGTSGLLLPNELVDVEFTVELNGERTDFPCTADLNQATATGRGLDLLGNPLIDPVTLAVALATDLSDSGNQPQTPNDLAPGASAAGVDCAREDDPTPVQLPDIRAVLTQTNLVNDLDPCSNNVTVCFTATVKNTGNITLDDVAFELDFQSAGIGTPIGTPTITPILPFLQNPAYDGTAANPNTVDAGVSLLCGERISMEVCAVFDPSLSGDLLQGFASGTATTFLGPVGVFDATDSGDNPDTTNDLALGATTTGTEEQKDDDPTPVLMPRLKANKIITDIQPAASGVVGNFDVRYELGVFNTGNINLVNLQMDDDLLAQLGPGFVGMVEAPNFLFPGFGVVTFPTFNTGFGVNPVMTGVYDGTSGELGVGGLIVATFVVEIDADQACAATNQMLATGAAKGFPALTVVDLSDGGTFPFSPNPGSPGDTGGCDDPTPIELPDVHLTKRVASATQVADPTGCTNRYTVVFEYIIENTGNLPIDNAELFDQLNAAANLDAGFVSATAAVVSGPAAANGGYNGTSAAVSIISATGPLLCGGQIVAQVTAVVDADLTPFPAFNQANVTGSVDLSLGLFPPLMVVVADDSDSGNNPDSPNDGASGATAGGQAIDREDDPTPVLLPKIKASKEVLGFAPAASGVIGNFDVDFRISVLNTGNVPLSNLQVDEINLPGANMVALVVAPFAGGGQTSTVDPVFEPGFFTTGNVFDGTSGLLEPDQLLEILFTVEMNADAICIPRNQVIASGRFVDPVTNAILAVSDFSDSGADPNDPNVAAPSSTAGCDDPTPIELPDIQLTKAVASAAQVVDPTGCTNNYTVVFRYVVENTGSIALTNAQLFDQLDAATNLGAGLVAVTNVAVVSGPATANGGFNGTSAAVSIINPTGPLACGQQIVATVTATVNADLTPAPDFNQATTTADWTFTNVPATTGTVTDLSDSGTDPESANNGAPGATTGGLPDEHDDDPTPVFLPKIKSAKEVLAVDPAASGVIGNFDVTFRVSVLNTGNVPLSNLQVDELNIPGANMVAATVAPFAGGAQNATIDPVFEPGFFSTGNIFDGTSGELLPDEELEIFFTMEVNADAICIPTNQVLASGRFVDPVSGAILNVSDLSDSGPNPNDPNAGAPSSAAGCNDPTPLELPDIRVTKAVQSATQVVDPTGCTNNYTVVYRYVVENTGSIPLTAVTLKDQLNAVGNLGAGFVSLTNVAVVSGPAAANGAYTGTNAATSIFTATGPLPCSQQIVATVTAVFNADLTTLPPTNQATAMANWAFTDVPATTGMVTDLSDSGTDPESPNDAAAGASMGGTPEERDDDPTPVFLPKIKASKEVTAFVPAASGVIGNFDVTFRVRVLNTGNVPLDRLQVDELNIPAANMVALVGIPTTEATQTATIAPIYGQDFMVNGFLFDGTSGLLEPDQLLDFSFMVEMNADAICIPTNQVLASGRFLNEATGVASVVSDLSDSGSNPNGPNSAAPSSAAGCNDPTPVELPDIKVTKAVQSAVQVVDPTGCTNNYTVTFRYVVENTGSISLTGATLKDQLNSATNLGAGLVSVTNVAVVSGPATANAGFLGTNNTTSIFTATGPLPCSQQIIATVTAIVNADLTPVPDFNQATAMANWAFTNTPATTGMVTDLSDSGTDPESCNDAAPGATLGGLAIDHHDDPTPVYLPKIKGSKEVVACGPAASGTLGNMDVTVHFVILNTGNTPLDRICLTDDIKSQMGAATIVNVVEAGTTVASTATIFPQTEPLFNGGSQANLFDCTSGLLMPDQIVDAFVTFEINPNGAGFVLPALNQATVQGRPVNFAFQSLGLANVSDLTDGGSNPNDPNAGYPGNTGGCNDRTPISLPQLFVAKEAIACVPSGLTLPGEFDYTFRIRIQNTGNVRLQNVSAIDDLIAQIGAAYLSKVGATTVSTTGNAGGVDPVVNAAYAGSGNLIGPANLLQPGAVTTITWTARINPNALLPRTNLSNQVFSSATGLHPNVPGGLVLNQIVNTPGTATPKPVTDLSDSGSIPEDYNVGEPGDMSDTGNPLAGEDDPTPIEIPSLNVSKAVIDCVPTSNTEPGMFNLTFRINVENTGNVHLDSLRLDDSFLSLGAAFKGILEMPHYTLPPLLWLHPGTFNPTWNGKTDFDIFNDVFNELRPGEKFTIEFKVKIDPNAILPVTAMCNQARGRAAGVRADGTRVLVPKDGPGGGTQKRTLDFSDSGVIPESTNPGQRNDTGIHDDCTPIEIPSINIAKYVTEIIKVPGEVPPGNARLTFEIKAENTGNVDLRNTQLVDSIRTLMGTTWLQFAPGGLPAYVTTGMMATTVPAANRPVLNPAFTGLKGAGANIFNGTSGIIRPGQFVTIRMTVDLDPNAVGAPDPLKNQAWGIATGFIIDWTNIGTPVPTPTPINGSAATNPPRTTSDHSDSGKVPESNNIGEPCDQGTHNDPTPFEIPFNLASKWEVPNPMGTNCARSEVDGNMDIAFHIKYVNVGNTWLRNLRVVDDLMMQFGPNFVQVINGSIDIVETESNATELPSLNWAYNGKTVTDILTGTDGLLAPNEYFVVRVMVEINPNAPGTIKPYDNQGVIYGLAVRENGTKVFVPCTTNDFIWDDRTDAGELPETTNPGYPGDTGGSNDPYDFRLPMSTAFAQDLVIYPSCITGIDEYLIPWIDAHGGAVVMAHPECGPIEWTSNFMGSLDWLPAKQYGCGCTGIWEIEWNAKDQCGHDVCHDAFVEIKDTAAPCWDMDPMDKVVLCGAGMQNAVQKWLDNVGDAWFFDNCSKDLKVWNSYNPATVNACDEDGSVITFYLQDACGNTSSRRANLKIVDYDAPVFTNVPANLTMTCGAPIPPPANVVATDDCTASPTITMTETIVAGNCPGESTRTRVWTATDFCGNTASASQKITVVDDAKPGFTSIPANLTITCPAVPVFGTPTATDVCSGSATITFVDDIVVGVSCPGGYTVRRTWTATDGCGNTRTAARTIKVLPDPNNVASVVTLTNLPSNKTIQCGEPVVYDPPTASSNCTNPTVALTFLDNSTAGSCTVAATFTRTWTATDACGSTATATQKVTQAIDNQPPVFTFVPADQTIACGETAVFGTPLFTDNCTASPILTAANANIGGLCTLGNTNIKSRTWTARDQCGNTSTAKQTITTSPQSPTMAFGTMPAETVISCSQPVVFAGQPTVNSTCPTGQVTLAFVDNPPTGGGCADAVFTRTWTATDGCGNSIQGIQIVTQQGDAIDPNFLTVPAGLLVDCSTLQPTVLATGADNCSGAAISFSVETLGSNPCAAQWANAALIHWTATDGCGNEKAATSPAYTAADIFGISFLSVQNFVKTYACGEAVEWESPTCITGCPANNSVKIVFNDSFGGDCASGKTITRTWTATDDCGHLTSTSLTQFMAPDTQAPTITFQNANEILPCGAIVPTLTPDVNDNCLVQSIEAIGDISNGSQLLRVWKATDACGNTTTAVQKFTFVDIEAPVFTSIPTNIFASCEDPTAALGNPTATDACGSVTVTSSDFITSGTCAGNYSLTRKWTAKDESGNTATCQATLFVTDTKGPAFSNVPTDEAISCDGSYDFGQPTVTDCSGASVLFADVLAPGTCTGDYIVTRTWTATDGCGNTAIAFASVELKDDVPPVFATNLTDQTLTWAAFEALQMDATATDNCSFATIAAPVQTQELVDCELTKILTWTATDDCGNAAQKAVRIDIVDEFPGVTATVPTDLTSGQTFDFSTVLAGGVAPFTFSWTITGQNWSIVGGEQTSKPTVLAGKGKAFLTLSITNGTGCSSLFTWDLDAETVSTDEQIDGVSFDLFPVPTADFSILEFELLQPERFEIRLLDAAGRQLETRDFAGQKGLNRLRIDLVPYAAGSYLLEVRSERGTISRAIIKQ